jgi:glycosyltransferase involved in cell wall biosynthesis
MMKVAVLHSRLSGYLAACLREFKARTGAELLIYCWPNQRDAPFEAEMFADLGEVRNRREHADAEIEAAVRDFRPDAILTSGWVDRGYVKICKSMRKQGVPVIAGCDTQWTGGLRQQVAAWTARWHVRKAIDVLWVTGERQAVLGRALGYHGERLWDGYYACDWDRFARGGQRPEVRDQTLEVRAQGSEFRGVDGVLQNPDFRPAISASRSFLYVGRYVAEKGLATLAAAYRSYSERVEHPWRLLCAGSGPLRDLLIAAGAEDLGFSQPTELPALMHSASAFILPSCFEPWGVVVHEAAASGLPLILSDACGAGVHLLRDQFNGFLFPAGDAGRLAAAMVRMTQMDELQREGFSEASFQLSRQYSPERWAATLMAGLR